MSVFSLRPLVTLESTHDIYDAAAKHARRCKRNLPCEPLTADNTLIQAQMDLLWFFCDLFFATYDTIEGQEFADFLYALAATIGSRAETELVNEKRHPSREGDRDR